jgi:hypothetical protein
VKRSFRNRAHILGANGLLRLSIPLETGKHQHSAMKEVRISYNQPWQKIHWQSLTSAYRRSPYFEFYEDKIRHLYTEPTEFLLGYNKAFITAIAGILKTELVIEDAGSYKATMEGEVKDLRSFIVPGKTLSGLNPYTQVFSDRFPFESDLSVLDLLFNLGPESRDYLEDIKF